MVKITCRDTTYPVLATFANAWYAMAKRATLEGHRNVDLADISGGMPYDGSVKFQSS